jgi:Tfp pilus assembly protein PilF
MADAHPTGTVAIRPGSGMNQGLIGKNGWNTVLFIGCLAIFVLIPCTADCGCSSGDIASDFGDSSSDSRMEQAQALVANGTSLLAEGRFTDALESYNASINLDPYAAPAWYGKADALYRLGRFQESKTAFERVIVLSPSDSHAWYYIGNITAKTGSLQSAVKAYDRAIAIRPDYPEAKSERELALTKLGPTKAPVVTTTPPKTVATPPQAPPASLQPTRREYVTPGLTGPSTPVPTSTPKTSLSPAYCIAGFVISCSAAGTLMRKAGKEEP